MCEKKVSFCDVIVLGVLSVLFLGSFFVSVFVLANSLKTPLSPSKHTLEWLPEKCPRIEKRFTIENSQIIYMFHLGEATGHLSFPFKSSVRPLTVHEIKSWRLLQNSLIVEYRIDCILFFVVCGLAIVFGGATIFFTRECLSRFKELHLKNHHLESQRTT
jgi:hypothetical protein